jgi:DNA recombination protein Rad52
MNDRTAATIGARLSAPVPNALLRARTGAKGRKLTYIPGHHAIRIANEVFGWDGWAHEVTRLDLMNMSQVKQDRGESWCVSFIAVVRVTVTAQGRPVTREDVGFGSGTTYDEHPGDAIEAAVKEAVTDGIKRALKSFGPALGLDLYDEKWRDANIDKTTGLPKAKHEPQPKAAPTISQPRAASILEHAGFERAAATELIRQLKAAGYDPVREICLYTGEPSREAFTAHIEHLVTRAQTQDAVDEFQPEG